MIFYDFEVFIYDWLVVFMDTEKKKREVIVNDRDKLKRFYRDNQDRIFVGFNSRNYDQYIFKALLCGFNPYDMSQFIIEEGRNGWEYSNQISRVYLLNYDIMTNFFSLKQLEAFQGERIKESSVPFTIKRKLTDEELSEVIAYCIHDVEQTMKVFMKRASEFSSHMSLINTFGLPMRNLNKTKAQLAAIILGAHMVENRGDDFVLDIPDNLKIEKYRHIVDWYRDKSNLSYDKSLSVDVFGVQHDFGWGGLHGARKKYKGRGIFLNMDVASLYPSIMIEYNFLSRNVKDASKYKAIRDERLRLKKLKDAKQLPYKLVLNSTYGASKDAYNALYDPRAANNVCVAGQLLLLDLIEHLEHGSKFSIELIQTNTDGILLKLDSMADVPRVEAVCREWQERTRLELEFDLYENGYVYQKDVNNYLVGDVSKNVHKSKGAYVKKLSPLDNDLPIVNRAIVDYLLKGMPVQKTIRDSEKLIDFQKVVKLSNKYECAIHNGERMSEKVIRVFASRDVRDGMLYKLKRDGRRLEKVANTPERCRINNENIIGERVPDWLDRRYYIDLALKRIRDFLGE